MTPEELQKAKLKAKARARAAAAKQKDPPGYEGSMADYLQRFESSLQNPAKVYPIEGLAKEKLDAFYGSEKDPGVDNALAAGFVKGIGNQVSGIRQAWNEVTGDEEELRQLQINEARRQQKNAEFGGVGEGVVGGIAGLASYMLPTAGVHALGATTKLAPLLAKLKLPDTASLTARTVVGGAGGAAGGAAAGYTSNLTLDQEGQREENTKLGAGLGLLLGAAGAPAQVGISKVRNWWNQVSPEEGLREFIERGLRFKGGTNKVDDLVSSLRTKGAKELDRQTTRYTRKYSKAENAPGRPIILSNTAQNAGQYEALLSSLGENSSAARILNAIKEASVSPLLTSTGQKIAVLPRTTSIRDVRETQRILKAKLRGLKDMDPAGNMYRNLLKTLDDDLTHWASSPAEAKKLRTLKKIDQGYRKDVVPLKSKDTAIGRWHQKDYSEDSLRREFDTADNLEELVTRVPGVKREVRQLYGADLDKAGATEAGAKLLSPSSRRDILLDDTERQYAQELAAALRSSPDKGSAAALIPPKLRALVKKSTIRRPGQTDVDPEYTDELFNLLRSYGIVGAVENMGN